MIEKTFVHLHMHTHYSLLDGMVQIPELIEKAKSYNMPAIAITDHGNLFGAIEFYQEAKKREIKPIIGCEIYISNGPHSVKKKETTKNYFHLILLAKNLEGYYNLCKIVSIGYLEGFYYRPRIDKETLKQYSKGLIALSGCLGSEIPHEILETKDPKIFRETLDQYLNIFGENFYLELQDHGISNQKKLNSELYKLSMEYKVPIVATNDVHYLSKEDAEAHRALICIATQTYFDSKLKKSLDFKYPEFYFKSYEEMKAKFKKYPDAIENTVKIANLCEDIEFDFKKYFPVYKCPDNLSSYEYIKILCDKGLKNRYKKVTDSLKERLEHEMTVIINLGFVDYFLIVYDLIQYARSKGIFVGPGRGSVVGSLVSYVLEITQIDPIKYHLLFERFLSIERISMPDIDIDIEDDRRDEVIQYIFNKYGKENTANIITFGSLRARAVIRDVGRVLRVSLRETDQISKSIPHILNIKLKDAIQDTNALKEFYKNKQYKTLFDYAFRLEGVYRHVSMHAAGIVISLEPLINIIPLYRDPKTGLVSTQYEGKYLEYCKILKLDLLGLRNLSILRDSVKYIGETRGERIDLNELPLQDQKTYDLLASGRSKGIFQVESEGMQRLLQKVKVSHFEDIIALIALYRPGPLDSAMDKDFIEQKHDETKRNTELIQYFPELKNILQETYGIILYQEQVMEIARSVAGFSLYQADLLRKAISKKNSKDIEILKDQFLNGVKETSKKKLEDEIIHKLYNLIETFGRYGFNKSHSTAYAMITYQTAYLKANYPLEYMAALLSSEKDNSNKIVDYIQEAKDMGIRILNPCIQKSDINFKIEGSSIRASLLCIKNLGGQVLKTILECREKNGDFKDIIDFLSIINLRVVNKKALEFLIKSGAFDCFDTNRASLLENISEFLKEAEWSKKQKISVEEDLFAANDIVHFSYTKNVAEWSFERKLFFEKEAFGFYLSGDPLKTNQKDLEKLYPFIKNYMTLNLEKKELKEEILIFAYLEDFEEKVSKNNTLWAILTLRSFDSILKCLIFKGVFEIFKKDYEKFLKEEDLKKAKYLIIKGHIEDLGTPIKVIANKIFFPFGQKIAEKNFIEMDKSLNNTKEVKKKVEYKEDKEEDRIEVDHFEEDAFPEKKIFVEEEVEIGLDEKIEMIQINEHEDEIENVLFFNMLIRFEDKEKFLKCIHMISSSGEKCYRLFFYYFDHKSRFEEKFYFCESFSIQINLDDENQMTKLKNIPYVLDFWITTYS